MSAGARPWHASYDAGVPARLEYEPWTLSDLLAESARAFPTRDAIVFGNRSWSWSQLAAEVERAAAGLAELGVVAGERVAIHLPNLPQTVVAFFAVQRAGAVAVMTNPLSTARELGELWAAVGVRALITTDFLWVERDRELARELAIERVVLTGIAQGFAPPLSWIARFALARRTPARACRVPRSDGVVDWRALVRTRTPAPELLAQPGDVALLQPTGGTTGRAKACALTHANLCANLQQLEAWLPGSEAGSEVVLLALPLFHVFGLTVAMNLAVRAAATMVPIPDPRDAGRMLKSLESRRVTALPAVPAMFDALADHPACATRDLSSVRLCVSGAAPLSEDCAQRFEALSGRRVVEGYGMSECSPVALATPIGASRRPGSVGVPLPDTDARIVDAESGEECEQGQAGELRLRGPQVMQGYWERPEESAATLVDGWLCTGDLASMDADGWFRLVGRLKDIVLVGGYNVHPQELDAVLAEHPGVLEAASAGVPTERGERLQSWVVPQPGCAPTADELLAHCRERLAPYKLPREIRFLDELPRSAVLKVLRRELVQRALDGSGGREQA